MTIPHRGQTGRGTYFITTDTYLQKSLFQTEHMCQLFIDVLYHYRQQGKYELQEFVLMPDHFHLLITPCVDVTLEKGLQFIKGGFSFRAKKELGFQGEIWQTSFHDHRVRDAKEYQAYRVYIHENPVKRGLVARATHYQWSSANLRFKLDPLPQRLKPLADAADMQA
jgi:putative transposase